MIPVLNEIGFTFRAREKLCATASTRASAIFQRKNKPTTNFTIANSLLPARCPALPLVAKPPPRDLVLSPIQP
jgi:hypothetical protein